VDRHAAGPGGDHVAIRWISKAGATQDFTYAQLRQFLGQVIAKVGAAPKHLVSDHGGQFDCPDFKQWCQRRGIRQRMGAVGQRGSIAVVERFIGTLKREGTRALSVVPLLRRSFQRELQFYIGWYNGDRAHMTLAGTTPDEVYFGRRAANRSPRFEPRPAWPRGAPCALPQVLVKGQAGVEIDLNVAFASGCRHLPRVPLRRAG
jgi:hypothetical protein